MRRARLLWLLLPALATRPATAQWQASADIGASQLRRPDIPQSSAVTLGANVGAVGDRGWLRSSVLAVAANSQQSTAQGLLAGSIAESSDRFVRGALTGFVSGFGESGYSLTLSGEIMPRVEIGDGARGGALGFGVGGTQHAGVSEGVRHAAAEAWWVVHDEQLASSLSFVKTSGSFVGAVSPSAAPSYYDLTGAWRHERGGFELGASGGYRRGVQSTKNGSWGSLDAALWMLPRTAVVASFGRTLDDPVRGVPQTTFASVGVRLTAEPHQAIARRRGVKGASVSVRRVDASRRQFEIRGVKGTRVEIMGDFTNWTPVDLEAAGDVWRFEKAVAPGLHQIALRVDGGEWIAPVNLPRKTDDLGGVVGLITVP